MDLQVKFSLNPLTELPLSEMEGNHSPFSLGGEHPLLMMLNDNWPDQVVLSSHCQAEAAPSWTRSSNRIVCEQYGEVECCRLTALGRRI